MGEHDDDLESTVFEDATTEIESFPDTADDFDDELFDDAKDGDESLDDDEAEL
jgi:hypothetical protein